MKPTSSNEQKPIVRNLLNLSIFSAYFYAFMEWVFFITKPSSLSILAPPDAVRVLVITGGIFALLMSAATLIISLPSWFTIHPNWKLHLLTLGHIVPALMLTITVLIMFDNFTYTVFKFGVVSTTGLWRALYILGLGIVFWGACRFVRHRTRKGGKKFASYLSLGLLTVSISVILASNITPDANPLDIIFPNGSESSAERPHIIILGSDGLTASYLSAYGYDEKTTPFLEQMAEVSLVAENAFTNASSTTGSTTSALTGKAPAVTKVFRYPDPLSGQDTIEHLPGILKQYGYKTIQIGTPYYVDALKLNLVEGFDIVNNQPQNLPLQSAFNTVLGNTASTYFINTLVERVKERLLHIFFIQEMQNPVEVVKNPKVGMTDEERVDQIISSLDQTDSPVFIFAHLMDTHGPHFGSREQGSTSDTSDGKSWDKERYKEAILRFDSYLEKIYTHLDQTGQLDKTILVIYTDHGYKYAVNHRIPVVFHFPKHEYAGSLENNVQILDIPVTLMDYLNISSPTWMTGTSLLDDEPPADREIISIVSGSPKKVAPPFFQIKIVQFIICHKYYQLNVQTNKWSSRDLAGHTAQCDEDQVPSDEIVHQKILDYLEKFDYDISSLQ